MYLVELDGKEQAVSLQETKRGVWTAKVGGESWEMRLLGRNADGSVIVVVDGVERVFGIHRNGCVVLSQGELTATVNVIPSADIVLEELGSRIPETTAQRALQSPITGIILDVLVKPGQPVVAGQPLVVVEAMKMENTLSAPRDATIGAVSTTPGSTVFAGDDLILFD